MRSCASRYEVSGLLNNLGSCIALCALLASVTLPAAERRALPHRVPAEAAHLAPKGRLSASQRLDLAIGLPLRNREALNRLIAEQQDRSSTNFHKWLTPEQFTERFGPSEEDFQTAINFAKANGLEITRTYPNRALFDVTGTVGQIEKAFHVALHTFKHPTEDREFYAPDTAPSVEAAVPILEVTGINNYVLPRPMGRPMGTTNGPSPSLGSEPTTGSLRGTDFRNAYVPGATLNGSGQLVGLVEFDGYFPTDVTTYETQSGLPNVPLQIVPLPGSALFPTANRTSVGECSLDIEMVIAMAPGLARIVVFEGTNTDDILMSMAASNQIAQFSCSWGMVYSFNADSALGQMTSQGQSFFAASGDGGAYTNSIPWPSDHYLVTSVGGTTLTMNGLGASYASETVWNTGLNLPQRWFGNGQSGYWASGGGISPYPYFPSYQAGIDFSASGGSYTRRNIPDVAMPASGIWVNYFNGLSGAFIGTSCAAPLWAGFTALVNQQAVARGQPTMGFMNNAIYQIGKSLRYASTFHDTTIGNNTWPGSPRQFNAVPGFDLCTGWGSPNGTNLINALITYAGAVWVDFSYQGTWQLGSYDDPFRTLAQGTNAVPASGDILIKPGLSLETMTISKPMTLRAHNGDVRIGHQ
jgi:subtilase family serine protease